MFCRLDQVRMYDSLRSSYPPNLHFLSSKNLYYSTTQKNISEYSLIKWGIVFLFYMIGDEYNYRVVVVNSIHNSNWLPMFVANMDTAPNRYMV